jgi:putative aldouronate transport system permease protein
MNMMKQKSVFKVRNAELTILILPALLYFLIFHYFPMYGLQIAFKEFNPFLGIVESPWVGLEHFSRFFSSYHFWDIMKNTLGISLYSLILGFPMPIILALMMNEMSSLRMKRIMQTVVYAPHFISTVVMVGILYIFLRPQNGLVNRFIVMGGGESVAFLTEASMFKTIYVFSGIWQNTGWGTVIYLASLSAIDPQIVEAAIIDGASRWQRMIRINIPGILPMVIILFILNTGRIMNVGFEKVYLMQNPLNLRTSEIIATYVYRSGLQNYEYSFGSAVGFFNSVVNFLLLILVNTIAKKTGESSLW